MKIKDLIKDLSFLYSNIFNDSNDIFSVEYDSRKVSRNSVFIAIQGEKQDGNDFIDEAIKNGACLIVSDKRDLKLSDDISYLICKDARRALSKISAIFYGYSYKEISLIGVTGTNGKTTTALLLRKINSKVGKTYFIGTLGMGGDSLSKSVNSLTTPEANEIHKFIREKADEKAYSVVMETSSAGVFMKRTQDLSFDQMIFTNFSGDHLDFHPTMDDYFNCKLQLFNSLGNDNWAVINRDDLKSETIMSNIDSRFLTYGFTKEADIFPLKYNFDLAGIKADISTPSGIISIKSNLIGRLNLYNIMAAVSSALISKIPLPLIQEAIAEFNPVTGRLDCVYEGDFKVFIDYAHTDAAIESLLKSLRELSKGRLIIVFGAGGDRDKSKRARMALLAAQNSDYIILTSDNPRSEDPKMIINDLIAGLPKDFKSYTVKEDRKEAIKSAVLMAKKGDIVIVAGKGHEDYQILKDKTIKFDDKEVVLSCIGELYG